MFTKSELEKLEKMCPVAREVDLGGKANFVKGAYTVVAADATAGKVTLTVPGFEATGMIAHMVSDAFAPVTLTVEKFAVSDGDTDLEFDTTTLAAGQIIYYLLW